MKPKLKLTAGSNASVKAVQANKVHVEFPSGKGVLQVGRSVFKNRADFLAYLSRAFPLERREAGYRVSISRKGKYQRVNQKNEPVFAFGDPLLDFITDEHGWVTIEGQRHNLRADALADPGARGGGIQSLDLSPRAGEMEAAVSRAAAGEGSFSIVEANAKSAVLASKNPSTLYFYDGNAKMRFRAFKSSYGVGWKMGADIETWGGNFTRARIESNYGFWIYGRACGVAKRDSDSDTNDDYVDEYEWGVFSSAPNGVNSLCTATWRGRNYSGYVSKGDCDFWI